MEQVSSNNKKFDYMNYVHMINNFNVSQLHINQNLKEKIMCGMPNYENNNLLKCIYIYIMLCKILTYNDEVWAMNQSDSKINSYININRINDITQKNNKILCYEFTIIYKTLLSELGILSQIIFPNNANEDNKHTIVRFEVDGCSINADSTTSILSGDLVAAKLNLKLKGLTCENESDNEMLINSIDEVYRNIIGNETKLVDNECFGIINCNNLNHVIKILIDKVNSKKLNCVECLAYLLYLKKRVLSDELKEKINIVFVRDNTVKNTTVRAIIIIKTNTENIEYYSYIPNQEINLISANELQEMFDKNKLAYFQDNEKYGVEGIKIKSLKQDN